MTASVRPALIVGIGLAIFPNHGHQPIIYYAPTIIQSAGVSSASVAILATAGIGVVSVASLGVYSDKEEPINAHEAFAALAREQAVSAHHCAYLYPYLESYPRNPPPDSESFIYWAKQNFGDLKSVIKVVHVLIHGEGNRVNIASKQLYSTHPTEAGLSVPELIPFADGQGRRARLSSARSACRSICWAGRSAS